MPKFTPNLPYDDLGDCRQLAEYHAAWIMNSSKSGEYLALSDFHPEICGSTVTRRASFADVQALASGLPILPQRTYRIGTEQGIVVLVAALIDRQYHWVATLEPPVARKINNPPLVAPKRTIDYSPPPRFDRPPSASGDRPTYQKSRPISFRRPRPDYRRR